MSHDNVNGKVNGDLISREGLLAEVDWERKQFVSRGQYGAEHLMVHPVRRLVEDAPAVDAVPVVHARWDDECVCSACEYQNKISMKSFDGSETISVYMPTRFCPSCGATMYLEEQHEQTKDSQTAEGTAENVYGE